VANELANAEDIRAEIERLQAQLASMQRALLRRVK
jgi:hypothetical protein